MQIELLFSINMVEYWKEEYFFKTEHFILSFII